MVRGLWSLIYVGTSELGLPENSGMGNEMGKGQRHILTPSLLLSIAGIDSFRIP